MDKSIEEKNKMVIKKKMEIFFIPNLERMINREELHISVLNELKNKFKYEVLENLLKESKEHLNSLKARLKEYQNYINK